MKGGFLCSTPEKVSWQESKSQDNLYFCHSFIHFERDVGKT